MNGSEKQLSASAASLIRKSLSVSRPIAEARVRRRRKGAHFIAWLALILLGPAGEVPAFAAANDHWDARFDWQTMYQLDAFITGIAVDGPGDYGDVYIGGKIGQTFGTNFNNVAMWSWSLGRWCDMGGGVGNPNTSEVLAVASGPSVAGAYVGGFLTNAGAVLVDKIAHWDGVNWEPVGDPNDALDKFGWVDAIALDGSTVYAGGYFDAIGKATNLNHIARWDGQRWNNLGSGVDGGIIEAIATPAVLPDPGNIWVGGSFTHAGGLAAKHIARWNGASWFPLGSGIEGTVNQIVAYGQKDVYVCGQSTTFARFVKHWDGTAWAPIGAELDGGIESIAPCASGVGIFACGSFLRAYDSSGIPASAPLHSIAKWDGFHWFPLGDGLGTDPYVWPYLVASKGDNLYCAGAFDKAGNKDSWSFAHWNDLFEFGPKITASSPLPVGYVGEVYREQVGSLFAVVITQQGGVAPCSWAVVSGALPTGLEMDAASGRITGTPASVTQANFRVRVTGGDRNYQEKDFSLRVDYSPLPSIQISGSSVMITNGATATSQADGTDFGGTLVGGGSVVRTFSIRNFGLSPLNLTGTPKVLVSGPQATDFTVVVQPTSPVPGLTGTTTFQVAFTPNTSGTRLATLTISNNDTNRNPFTFAIQGMGSPATLNASYSAASDVPFAGSNIALMGSTVNLSLNFAPATGTDLMVVNNTGRGFINGTFGNLTKRQTVWLS